MHHPKHLYITGLVTDAIAGLLSSLSAYGMIQFVATGNNVTSLSIMTTVVGAVIGLVVAFILQGVKIVKNLTF